jgi:hypothetical protein
VALVVVVWSALAGLGSGGGTLPEPPPIPVLNGYDDVLEAARAIEKSGLVGPKLDLAKADVTELQAIVRASHEAIARSKKGLEKSFQVPVIYEMNEMTNVTMRDLGSIRGGLVRAMVAQGRLAELEGRTDVAVGCYSDIVRLSEAMSHRVPAIAFQISEAIEMSGLYRLRDMRDELSPEQCRKLINLLEETDRKQEPADDAILYETAFMNANMKRMGFFSSISMKISGIQAKTAAQVTQMLTSSERRNAAARRVLLTDLAQRLYREEHGEAPPDLNGLVPSILKSVPVDPYTSKPLRYVKRGKDGVVYSAGPDRKDDNLATPLGKRHVDTTAGDFTIDSF